MFPGPAADAALVAITRVSGIVLGVMLSLLLSVIIFPKSASHQATDSMAAALLALADLSDKAWNRDIKERRDSLDAGGTGQRRYVIHSIHSD